MRRNTRRLNLLCGAYERTRFESDELLLRNIENSSSKSTYEPESLPEPHREHIFKRQPLKKDFQEKPLAYPKSVAFIISNEFCERFNFYGLRAILALYLTTKLQYDDDTSTVLFHIFTMLVYLFPIIGAVIADSWLGRFKTILYLSVVYSIGGVIIAVGAIPTLELPVKPATILGLLLIAIGTGGIKPCVSAFGGDQFRLPEQTKELATFFSLFYFAINAGSMISTSVTPILREDVHCFGEKDCFSAAFGVPACLMLLSVVIFVAGKKLYVMKAPAGNMIFGVTKCITDAIGGWRKKRKTAPRDHWLDYAEPTCGSQMVEDTKILFKILLLYLPFPVFWALFDQQGSRWIFQATRMDGETFGFTVKPDQMQVVNPLLILVFIPLFNYILYPLLAKVGIKRPLQKLTMGGLLAAGAFLLSAFVELKLQAEEPLLPGGFRSQLRIYNGMPCRYTIATNLPYDDAHTPNVIQPLGLWEEKNIMVTETTIYKFNATSTNQQCPGIAGDFRVPPGKAVGYFIANDQLHEFIDMPEKNKLGNPQVRVLLNIPDQNSVATLTDSSGSSTKLTPYNASQVVTTIRGSNTLTVDGKTVYELQTRQGGLYVIIVNGNSNEGYLAESYVILPPSSVHIMWQLPQIIVITAAEIMFSVTGLEFSFTQAPQSMKSVLQACWLLTVAIGNIMVVFIAKMKFFESQAAEFVLFAVLMVVDMLIFMILAARYTYVTQTDEPDSVVSPPAKAGHSNTAYESSD